MSERAIGADDWGSAMRDFKIGALLDRAERRVADGSRTQRLMLFMDAITEDHILQVSVALAGASLWLTLAFGDGRFLVLLPAAIVAVQRFRELEQKVPPDEDDDWI